MIRNFVIRGFLIAGVLAARTALGETLYQVTDLGVLSGGVSSTATSIDNEDEVTGYTTFADGSTEAFYWSPSAGMIALGNASNGDIAAKGFAVNNGNVVGVLSNNQGFR